MDSGTAVTAERAQGLRARARRLVFGASLLLLAIAAGSTRLPVFAQTGQAPVESPQAAAGVPASQPVASDASGQPAGPPDTDGDTMPDAWETFFGLDPDNPADAALDTDTDGLTNAQEYATGGHPEGRHRRYFAEGSTGFFDLSFGLINTHPTDAAHVQLRFLLDNGQVHTHQLTLAARNRTTVSANTVLAALGVGSTTLSTIVESDVPIGADRVMRWGPGGYGSSVDAGVEAASSTWYFAEGSTGVYSNFYLLMNPGQTPASVTVKYLREGGGPITKSYTLPAHSRSTINVNTQDFGLLFSAMGAAITSNVPIVAERSMYYGVLQLFGAGTSESASPQLSTVWHFAEGSTAPFFDEFIAMVNPSATPATATVTYRLPDGTAFTRSYVVPAERRYTLRVNHETRTDPGLAPLENAAHWISISSTQPIAAERVMWFPLFQLWYEGTTGRGTITPGTSFVVPEGSNGGPQSDQTYVLIANTSASAGQVALTLVNDAGTSTTRTLPIGPFSRLSVDVGNEFSLGASRFSLFVESTGVAPATLVVDYARYASPFGILWQAGGATAAIPVAPVAPVDEAPVVTSTTPATGATGVGVGDNLTVNFSEPVNVTAGAFTLACPTGTAIALTNLTASPAASFTLDPTSALPADTSCVLTVVASQVSDADSDDPPDLLAADYVVSFQTETESEPSVTATTPANGAAQVATNTSPTVTFSEPVNVAGNWFQIVCSTSGTRNVADTVVSGGPALFTIDPNADFAEGESCTLTVVAAQVTDQDAVDPPDVMAANHVVSYTVDSAPTVTATTPTIGATEIATNVDLSVTFSEPVNVTGGWFQIVCSVSGTRNVGDTVVSGGPTAFVINPNADFAPGESCTVTVVAAQVADQDAGDPPDTLAANYVFGFAPDTPPTVTATTPASGTLDATTNASLTVTFSEAVNVTGSWFQIVCATSGTRNVGDTIVSGGPASFVIDPNVDFAAGESCTVTIAAAAVTDQDAGDPPDAMAADFAFTFATDAAPAITATTPTNGAVVASNSNLSITFSENVNLAGSWFSLVCATSGTRTVGNTGVSGGPAIFALDPNVDFTQGESCTLTVAAAQVSDQDAADPPDTMAADHVVTFTVDAQPTVTGTTPTNGAMQVLLDANLTVTFSEAVNVAGNWFQIACATSGTRDPAQTVVSGGPTIFTINPTADFVGNESCTVTAFAAQVTDQDAVDPPDSMAANHVFSFATDAVPAVTATVPTNGTTQVLPGANLTVTFSESVNATTSSFALVCASNPVPYALSASPASSFTLDPTANLLEGASCTLTVVAAQITDEDGFDPPDTMLADVVVAFTTEAAPTVVSTLPANGAMNVVRNATITINFSESVNATGASFTLACPSGVPQPFNVSGSPGNSILLTPTTLLPAGAICDVTVLAAGITDADTADPPDNLAANHTFSFAVPPDAVNDGYNAIGNVVVDSSTGAPFTVLANDLAAMAPVTVTNFQATTANGGTVTMTTSGGGTGQFVYNPPVGFSGADSFTYEITNPAGSDTATVTFTVVTPIWFIDNTSACVSNCNGRQTNPFTTLAAFNTVNNGTGSNPAAADHVFIYESSTPYTGAVALQGGQRLIGQDATTTLAAITGLTVPPGSSLPALNSGNGIQTVLNNTVTLNSSTVVRGLRLVTTGVPGMIDPAGAIGAVSVGEISIATAGAPAVSFSAIDGTLSFISLSSSGSPTDGIVVAAAVGSFTVTGTGAAGSGGTIQNAVNDGISLNGARNVSLISMSITDPGRHGIFGTGVTNFALTNSSITGSGDAVGEHGLDFGTLGVNNLLGTATVTNTTISGMHQHGITVENVSGTLTMTITDTRIESNHSTEGGDGILFQAGGSAATAANMTLTVNETTPTGCVFQNLNGDAIQVNTEADATAGSVTTLNVNGCSITNVGGGSAAIFIGGINGSVNRGFFDIRNNTLTGVELVGIAVFAGDDSELEGVILNNTVDTTGGEGMVLLADGGVFASPSPAIRTAVRGNNVNGGSDIWGIRVASRDGSGRVDLQLEGNTVAVPLDVTFGGADGVNIATEDAGIVCLDVQDAAPLGSNNSSGGTGEPGSGLAGYRLRHSSSGSFFLEGYGGGPVATFFTSHANTGSVAIPAGAPVAGSCTTP